MRYARFIRPSRVTAALDPDQRHVVVVQSLSQSEVRETPDLGALVAASRAAHAAR